MVAVAVVVVVVVVVVVDHQGAKTLGFQQDPQHAAQRIKNSLFSTLFDPNLEQG